jgi:cell division protein FtsA
MAQPPIVALEIGTTRVRALVGEMHENGQIMIVGVGECRSRGVRKGGIIHFENAMACVKTALDSAEEQANTQINQVHLVVTGEHIRGMVNRGSVPVMSADREITCEDVDRVMELARAVSLPTDRNTMHTICQHFYIDGQEGVARPEGMEGSKLELDMLILHGISSIIRNFVKIVKSLQVEVEDVAFSGLCSSLAVLTAEQKESGVIVIDMGGGTTDYLVYAGQAIACAGSLSVGGDHVTNDIALGLSLPITQAERIKCSEGYALVNPASHRECISLPAEGGFPGKVIRLTDLHTIINARVEEMLNMVKLEIDRYGVLSRIGAGVIVTGGGAHLKGLNTLVEEVFEMPCSTGRPRNVSGLAVVTEGPEYAAPLGMIRYGFKNSSRGQGQGMLGKLKTLFGGAAR